VTFCSGNSANRKEYDSVLILQLECDEPIIVVEAWV
jgi:hypothetical protein